MANQISPSPDADLVANVRDAIREALKVVYPKRFYNTERGFQGIFYCSLLSELEKRGVVDGRTIAEMEYQKTPSSHPNVRRQRPDIIVHAPSAENNIRVDEGNLAVLALKRDASVNAAREDFEKLDYMIEYLKYEVAFFINLGSHTSHLRSYTGQYRDRLQAFCVQFRDDGTQPTVIVRHSYWENGEATALVEHEV